MKKRYCLAIVISVLFLLSPIFVFAGLSDIWKECITHGDTNAVKGIPYYCCSYGISYRWQNNPCCTDNDGDFYIKESINQVSCGNACGPSKNQACTGNNDCNDANPTVHALISCKYDGINCGNYQLCLLSCQVPPQELCDNKDNDCDGLVDESLSKTVSCGTGACSRTQAQTCSAGLWIPSCTPGSAGTETCNNIDDDCDGAIDESLFIQCGSSDVGACQFGTSTCLAGVLGPCIGSIEPSAELCDGADRDCDGLVNCQDPDCQGSISGNVKNIKNQNIADARVEVTPYSISNYAYTTSLGNYQLNSVLCGTYDVIASAAGYVSSTKPNINLPPKSSITVDFTGLILGTTCEDDCTYTGDNIIHKECDGIDSHGADLDDDGRTDCDFYDNTAKEVCNFAQPGWIREYDATREIECAEGAPRGKTEVKASVTCEQENLIKLTKLVTYKGKLVKLVVVTCG